MRTARRSRKLLIAALGVVAAVAMAAPASAHVVLQSTEPAPSAQLRDAPKEVLLRFSEPVELPDGAVRLYDSDGTRVDGGARAVVRGESVALPLDRIGLGGHVVTWRVVSSDGHPIRGAFTFRVGTGGSAVGDTDALTQRLLAAEGGDARVGGLLAAVRILTLGTLVVLVGGAAFLLTLWPGGWDDVRARRTLWTAFGVVAVTALIGTGLQGAYAAGLPIADSFRSELFIDAAGSRFG